MVISHLGGGLQVDWACTLTGMSEWMSAHPTRQRTMLNTGNHDRVLDCHMHLFQKHENLERGNCFIMRRVFRIIWNHVQLWTWHYPCKQREYLYRGAHKSLNCHMALRHCVQCSHVHILPRPPAYKDRSIVGKQSRKHSSQFRPTES